MHLHLLSRCALLLLTALAGPIKALEIPDVELTARLGTQEAIAEPINAGVTPMNGPGVGGQVPLVQRWWARPETWGSGYRWSSTTAWHATDLTEQTRHSARLARGYLRSISSLRQTEDRRLALFEGAARSSAQRSFVDKLDVGWTLSPSGEPLPRQAREPRRNESDPLTLRLRRSVVTVLAQRTF